MKIKSHVLPVILLSACAVLRSAAAAPPVAAACCDVKAAAPACCAAHDASATNTVAGPLSSRSIYQLDAKWASDDGQALALADLRGRPVVMTMFFASCAYACPLLVSDMQRLRELLPAEVRESVQFVLVSFDPKRDTPAALNEYRAKHALDQRWTLLTGDADSIHELAMILGVKYKQDANGQFSHSNLITVLNAEGEVSHQRNGLMGDVSEMAKAVSLAAAK